MEPVAVGIRNDERVKGLKLPGTASEVKLSLYADDTNAIVTTMESIQALLQWFRLYGDASGAQLNLVKCKGLWIGVWKGRSDAPFNFVWSNCNKIIGVFLV
jgi:hypothetical protein